MGEVLAMYMGPGVDSQVSGIRVYELFKRKASRQEHGEARVLEAPLVSVKDS